MRDAATAYPHLRLVARSGQARATDTEPPHAEGTPPAMAEAHVEDGWVRSRDGGMVRVGAPGATAAVYGEP